MLNVSDETIRAYTEYGVDKHIIISFPNDNIPDITNNNIKEESLSLSSSISSDNKLTVQGCNATQLKITTFDITKDLTGKNIIVTLSLKDDNYKGEWQNTCEYTEGDIVKFDEKYYEYVATPPEGYSEYTKRNILNLSSLWKKQDDKYSLEGRSPEGLKGIKITGILNIPSEINVIVRNWFINGPYYKTYTITKEYNNKDIEFDKEDSSGNPLAGWFMEISNNGLTNEEFIAFIDGLFIVENSSMKKSSVYPCLSEYCEQKYGYYDTSEIANQVIFRGKVDSYTKQSDPRYKEIVAYDKFYELQNKSVKNWINTLDSNGKGYIELYNYQGKYKQNVEYKTNQVVFEETSVNGKTVKYYYRFKRTYDFPNFQRMTLANVYTASISNGTLLGTQYIERLTNYYPNRPTLKSVRDGLCKQFGLAQLTTIMNRDDQVLTIGKFNKEYSVTQMLQWICNTNLVSGVIDPTINKVKYVHILDNGAEEDEHYKGAFNPDNALSYKVGDIVKHTNKYNETRYYECCRAMKDEVFPSEFDITSINFINVTSVVKYMPPTVAKNIWYIEFIFNDEMAMELGVEVSIGKYKGDISKKVTQSCRINLQQLLQDNDSIFTIMVNNVTEEFWNSFSAKIYTATSEYNADWDLTDDELSDFWKTKNLLYHPNGRINLSYLYELDNIEVSEDMFEYKGIYVTDTENGSTPLYGEEDKSNNKVAAIYNPLFSSWTSVSMFYKIVDAPPHGYTPYQPFKIASMGLPFLEVGDLITFEVEEWSSDSNGEPVVETKTINSVILQKNMSGLNYLKDEYSAKKGN